MIEQTETGQVLTGLLDRYQEEIVTTWTDKILSNASFRPDDSWPETLIATTTRGLKAVSAALTTGDYASLNTYLTELNLTCIQTGFESSEVINALLLCKDAVLPIVRRVYPSDLDTAWALVSELDTCLRWTIGRFNTLYKAEMNRCLRKQHEQIAQILQIVQKTPEHLDLDEIFRQVAEGIITAVAADHCDFYLVSEDQSQFIPKRGVVNISSPSAPSQCFLERAPDIATDIFLRHVLEHKEPLTSYDAQTDPRVDQNIIGPMGIKSILAVPLMARNRVVAVAMTGTFYEHRAFTPEQIELAWNIAREVDLVIENVRLHEERLAENQSIQRIAYTLLQELEINEILKVICTETQQLTGAKGGAVYLLEDKGWLQFALNTGERPYLDRIPVEGSMTEIVLREGKPLVSNHSADDARLFYLDPGIRNMLVAPLRSNNGTLGALYAINKPWDFTEDDARIVGLFADQAAIAIENAQLHQQTQQMAVLEERERLAREIHDNLAQTLSVLKLQASHANDLLGDGQYERAQICLGEMKQMVTVAHADARDAIFSLRSSTATMPEFLAMLRAYLERYHNIYGLNSRLVVQDESHILLSPSATIQLTRIIQEALTNIRKHAEASIVYVRLEKRDGYLFATIEDDGQGFETAGAGQKEYGCEGVGLQIMRERAGSLGGELKVESCPGQGTRIVAHIPLSDRS